MAQTMEECLVFLKEAKDALEELQRLDGQEQKLVQEERQLEKNLEAERRQMADAVLQTVKKRREEVSAAYEKEIRKVKEQLKKMRSKREKAKGKGVRGRIEDETAIFWEQIRDLKLQRKNQIKREHLPGMFHSSLYYSLYFPHYLKEYLMLFLWILVIFLAVPWGIYWLLPEQNPLYLAGIYIIDVLVAGGGYIFIGNRTKMPYMEPLRECRKIQDQILENKKKIRKIAASVRKDKNEAFYNLGKYDDEIARLQQELDDVAEKQKDALNTFETVTKTILKDEIENSYKAKLEQMQKDYEQTAKSLKEVKEKVKEKRLYVTNHYGTYLGKEFMSPQKVAELYKIVESGMASSVSESIGVYQNQKK